MAKKLKISGKRPRFQNQHPKILVYGLTKSSEPFLIVSQISPISGKNQPNNGRNGSKTENVEKLTSILKSAPKNTPIWCDHDLLNVSRSCNWNLDENDHAGSFTTLIIMTSITLWKLSKPFFTLLTNSKHWFDHFQNVSRFKVIWPHMVEIWIKTISPDHSIISFWPESPCEVTQNLMTTPNHLI